MSTEKDPTHTASEDNTIKSSVLISFLALATDKPVEDKNFYYADSSIRSNNDTANYILPELSAEKKADIRKFIRSRIYDDHGNYLAPKYPITDSFKKAVEDLFTNYSADARSLVLYKGTNYWLVVPTHELELGNPNQLIMLTENGHTLRNLRDCFESYEDRNHYMMYLIKG